MHATNIALASSLKSLLSLVLRFLMKYNSIITYQLFQLYLIMND
ncbi:hypothetical protein KUCAC02_019660 [Chaenocephalus aceratus]|uniref:Uncharacterized protein n=1 Tax=Chaenocephalus aceratus TaxID=36190 RepID=A0ACB9VQ34_CHAAC|nr:hypothetical protein KUCAC02_019660 [Chaenocephalus aceratus]